MKNIDFYLRLDEVAFDNTVRACWLNAPINDGTDPGWTRVQLSPGIAVNGVIPDRSTVYLKPRIAGFRAVDILTKQTDVFIASRNDSGKTTAFAVDFWGITFRRILDAEAFCPPVPHPQFPISQKQSWLSIVNAFRHGTINISDIEAFCDKCLLCGKEQAEDVYWIYDEQNFAVFLKRLYDLAKNELA